MAKRNSFIFLPDISGFTEFVSHTEVEHSQHIIAELLELLIDHQQLGLTLAEIEGDALFYYRNEYVPGPKELMNQVEEMYIKFHSHLKLYEKQRICSCGACSTANNLTLKFIAHAGPLDFIQIKDQRKPYGKEVITAHRLMKNTIPIDDYLLLSQGVYDHWTEAIDTTLPTETSQSEYDLGIVKYQFYQLTPLKEQVKIPTISYPEKPGKTLASVSTIIKHTPKDIFELITNFQYRLQWTQDIEELKYDEKRVNRAGSKHHCVVDGKLIEFETVKPNQKEDVLVYGEKTEQLPVINPFTTYFTVKGQDGESVVTVEGVSESKSIFAFLLQPLLKRKLKLQFQKMLKSLKSFAEEHNKLSLMD